MMQNADAQRELPRIHFLKLSGKSQAHANRLAISRVIAAKTNASPVAHNLS